MPSFLDTMAEDIWQAFQGELLTGTFRKVTPNQARGFDGYNDPVMDTATSYDIEGFIVQYSEFDRAQAGIPATDVKFCWFARCQPGVIPSNGDTGQFRGQWYRFRAVDVDPALALWVCQAFALDGEPADGC